MIAFHPLQDIETKLRSLRLAEMYNSTQAQPQVPVTTSTSPWSKVKKKPRPNGGSDGTLDEEAGFIQTDQSLDGHDLYLDDHGVNLSPAVVQQQQQQQQHGSSNHHHNHQPITVTPLRRDRSLSPANRPVSNVITSAVSRSDQMPRSAPASPQKNRHSSNSAIYQQQQYSNGYNHQHHHHHHHQHPEIRRYLLFIFFYIVDSGC